MELSDLKGMGPKRVEALRAVGIFSLRDFLYSLPIKYEDHETEYTCADVPEGPAVVCGTVYEKPSISYFKGCY